MSRKMKDVMEGRFIKSVFESSGKEFMKEQSDKMRSRGFTTANFFTGRNITATDSSLIFDHLLKHRFVDMRHHQSGGERFKRKSHAIHNRMLYGKANDIIYRLANDFTDAVKQDMAALDLNT